MKKKVKKSDWVAALTVGRQDLVAAAGKGISVSVINGLRVLSLSEANEDNMLLGLVRRFIF